MAKDQVDSVGTKVLDNTRTVSPIANQKFNSPVTTFGTESFTGTPSGREGDGAFTNRQPSPVTSHGTEVDIPKGGIGSRCRPMGRPEYEKE